MVLCVRNLTTCNTTDSEIQLCTYMYVWNTVKIHLHFFNKHDTIINYYNEIHCLCIQL